MSGLAFLPSELLHAIFAYIFDPLYGTVSDRYCAFAGLARSCRALHSISTQYLYTRYEGPLEQPIAGFVHRLAEDHNLCQCLKHIVVSPHTGPAQHARPRKRLVTSIAHFPHPFRTAWAIEGNRNLAARNELELAILVLQATNLESMTMQKGAERAERTFDDMNEPPLWLYPLIKAGMSHLQPICKSAIHLPYQDLHSLILDLQHCNPSSLIHLFTLPVLKSLHLRNLIDHAFLRWLRNGGGWEDLNTYPDPNPWPATLTAHSPVTSLVLESVKIPTSNIIRTILACKKLETFSVTGDGNGDVVVPESRRWCSNVLDALKVHSDTLVHLRLDPDLIYPLLTDEDGGWPCIRDLNHFQCLKSLDTTFSNLFGHPQGHLDENHIFRFYSPSGRNWWEGGAGSLLKRCETVRIRFDGVLEINCDDTFLGFLHGNTLLKSLEVYYRYGNMFLSSTLMHPVNFWDVQRAFRKDGRVEFKYTIGFDLWGSGDLYNGL